MKIFLCIYGLTCFTLIHGDFLTGDMSLEDHMASRIVNRDPYVNYFNRNPVLQYLSPIYDFPVIYYYPKPVPRPDAIVLIRKKTNSATNFDPRVEISDFKPNPRITRSVWNDFDVKRVARKGEIDSREFRNRTGNVVRIQTYKNHSPGSRAAKKIEMVTVLSESLTQTSTQASKHPEKKGFVESSVNQEEEKAESALKQEKLANLEESPQLSNNNDQIAQENQQFAFVPNTTPTSEYSARLESLESRKESAKIANLDDSVHTNPESSLYDEDYSFFPSQSTRKSLKSENSPSEILSQYLPIYEDEQTTVKFYQNQRKNYDTSPTSFPESPALAVYSTAPDEFTYRYHDTYKTHEENSDSFEPLPLDLHTTNPVYDDYVQDFFRPNHLENTDFSYLPSLQSPKLEISPENDKINCLITTLTGETVTTLPPHLSDALPYTTQSSDVEDDTYPGNHQINLPSFQELETLEQAVVKLQSELPTPYFDTEPFVPYDMNVAIDSSISVPFASYVTDFSYLSFDNPESQYYSEPKFHEQQPIY